MVETVDDVFVKAISTIKTLSSRPSSGLSRPPPENRARLYGLYKQATEGNIKSLVSRPVGSSPQDQAGRNKWDAWKKQEGMPKGEAKRQYIQLLVDTMRNHATGTPESRKLLSELEESWARVSDHKFGVSRAPSVPSIYGQYVAPGGRAASIVSSRRNGGVANMSEFGVSQSYRSQTPSHVHGAAGSINVDPLGVVSPSLVNATAANASAAAAIAAERDTLRSRDGGISGMRGSISGQSFTEFDDTNIAEVEMRNWKQDVTWALETINEEMSAMRQRYLYAPLQGLTGTNIGNAGTNASGSAAGVASTGHDPALYSQFPPSLSANPLNNSAPPFIDHNYGAPSNSQFIGTRGNGGGAPGSPSPPISALQKSVMTMGYQFAKHLLIDLVFIIFVTRIVKWVRRKPAYLIRHPYMARLLRMAGSSLTFILFKVLKLDIRPM